MCMNLGHILPGATEMTAFERLKNDLHVYCCDPSNAFISNWISSIFAGNKENYKSVNELKFQSDLTLDCGVSCLGNIHRLTKGEIL